MLALNFKYYPFGVIVTRHFRAKSGNLNELGIYYKPIDRTLPTTLELWKLMVLG